MSSQNHIWYLAPYSSVADEVFHVRQAQVYCEGKYGIWDPKITTPPGLYLLSAAISSVFSRCDTVILRATNVVGILAIFLATFGCYLRLSRQNELRSGQPKDDGVKYLLRAYQTHSSLNVALFPPLFFFSALYYTDVLSTLLVLMSFDLHLQASDAESAGLQVSIQILFNGALALLFRQTNIFWVAVFPAGLTAVRVLKDSSKGNNAKQQNRAANIMDHLNSAWRNGDIYDCQLADVTFVDLFGIPASIAIAVIRSPLLVVKAVWPYLMLVASFGAFVVWNRGVVLGDKSNHVATIHLPQMLYIWPYITFFSFPLLWPDVVRLLWTVLPRSVRRYIPRIPTFASSSTKPLNWKPLLLGVTTFSALASAIVHLNTIVHPFTLADNRHYVFYVFRILRRPLVKYLATPVYAICAWLCIHALEGPSKRPGSETSFVIVWTVSCALTLCSAPLVEPRYFILPWIMWRLHVRHMLSPSDPSISKKDASPRKDKQEHVSSIAKGFWLGYDHRLWLETLWFLVVNLVTGYMFLHHGFAWSQEPGKVQRFMW
ncbi:MAG: glucosyltransferase [Bogoriella megaspora]|nr:MAG: glucosyltransferase [Bogoriella megaspora]